ncbi:MBL fold metallo-hydrolase [Pseudoxanthomonas suwonensis]|uniref:MBL fold metallo-hydrolase n=1 Tax=Pseudoxanthomonas suwonensis TaxID=314722 RepID=UPI0004B8A648|nr:MBL fold metallo-hydrolase [Pseudoxanthomonas suwonensis]
MRIRTAALSLLAVALATTLVACDRQDPSAGNAAPATEATAEAAAPATASDTVHAFAIGSLQATALRDGTLSVPNDNAVFGVGRTPEEVAEVLAAAGQPTDVLHLGVQPLLVRTGDRVLLFDTGAGRNMGDGAGKLGESLAAAGVAPGEVTDIFISHAHGDHVGGLVDAQGALAFPNATVRMTAQEWDDLRTRGTAEGADPVQAALVAAITPKVETFAAGAELVPGVVQAVEATGHTVGHAAYRITSGSDSLLYVGDSMHHHVISVQRPEWTIAFDRDADAGRERRQALLGQLADSGERVYAVHFPFPGLGHIERQGDGLVWAAE